MYKRYCVQLTDEEVWTIREKNYDAVKKNREKLADYLGFIADDIVFDLNSLRFSVDSDDDLDEAIMIIMDYIYG